MLLNGGKWVVVDGKGEEGTNDSVLPFSDWRLVGFGSILHHTAMHHAMPCPPPHFVGMPRVVDGRYLLLCLQK